VTASQKEVWFFLIAFLVFSALGCESRAKAKASSNGLTSALPEEANPQPKAATRPSNNLLKLNEQMIRSIRIEELSEKPMPTLLTTTGKVQFNEDRMARILAPVNGQAVQLNVKVGDPVRKGETLFFINSREVAAAITEHLEGHKDLDLAEKTFAMTRDLFEHEAASRISLQQAESDLAKARARVAQTEEALRVLGLRVSEEELYGEMNSRIPLRAPLSGTVIERHLTEGQFIQPDSNPLITIADLSTVWVLADVFERDLRRVRVGQRAEVTAAAYPDHGFVARVSRISDVLDPTTRTVKVRFLVSNPGARLKPEMFASVNLFLNESARGLSVPSKAVFTEGGTHFVYVCLSEGKFIRRQVEVLPGDFGRLKVASGLKQGERVVSDGALLLRQQENQEDNQES
jgi:cobalt-zinc-cadmium efflux system membrane fusion protein